MSTILSVASTNDGGRDGIAGAGAHLKPKGADFSHGVALYLENVSVWFDAFRALNDLSLYIDEGCAASLAPMVQAKPP